MPIYEYGCENCGKVDEVLQGFSDEPPEKCRFCGGGPLRKLISRSSFHLKGSGWYVTDYGGKNSSNSEPQHSVPADSQTQSDSNKSEEN